MSRFTNNNHNEEGYSSGSSGLSRFHFSGHNKTVEEPVSNRMKGSAHKSDPKGSNHGQGSQATDPKMKQGITEDEDSHSSVSGDLSGDEFVPTREEAGLSKTKKNSGRPVFAHPVSISKTVTASVKNQGRSYSPGLSSHLSSDDGIPVALKFVYQKKGTAAQEALKPLRFKGDTAAVATNAVRGNATDKKVEERNHKRDKIKGNSVEVNQGHRSHSTAAKMKQRNTKDGEVYSSLSSDLAGGASSPAGKEAVLSKAKTNGNGGTKFAHQVSSSKISSGIKNIGRTAQSGSSSPSHSSSDSDDRIPVTLRSVHQNKATASQEALTKPSGFKRDAAAVATHAVRENVADKNGEDEDPKGDKIKASLKKRSNPTTATDQNRIKFKRMETSEEDSPSIQEENGHGGLEPQQSSTEPGMIHRRQRVVEMRMQMIREKYLAQKHQRRVEMLEAQEKYRVQKHQLRVEMLEAQEKVLLADYREPA